MSLASSRAKANKLKPTTGRHRFVWGSPFGNAQTDNYSQIGTCSCGAQVLVSNHGVDRVRDIMRHAQRTAKIYVHGENWQLAMFEDGIYVGSVYGQRDHLVEYARTYGYKITND